MTLETDAARLLQQFDVLRHPSDLDLLLFFARHPRTLLSGDHLAAFVGYGAKDIAASLELLLAAGLLTRTPHSRHAARLYVLAAPPPGGGWLPALTRLATTRPGRLALIWALRQRSSGHDDRAERNERGKTGNHPLRFPPEARATNDARGAPRGASRVPSKRTNRGNR